MANNQNPENLILELASIGRLEREPRLYEKLADKILELISAGTWKPAFRLPPERELSDVFGVSRTVVRDAVEALEARGCLSPWQAEVEKLFRSIRKLTVDGAGVLYISHVLDEIFTSAGRVTVIRDGKVVLSTPSDETTKGALVQAMLGRQPSSGVSTLWWEKAENSVSVHRSVLGALLIGIINNGLSILSVTLELQLVAKGVIIVLALDRYLQFEK